MGAQIQFPKEQADKGIIKVIHVPSNDQHADMLTKPLGPQKFTPNRNQLMKTLLMLMTIFCVSANVNSELQTTGPIIYGKTNYLVEDKMIEYEIDFTYINPCDAITNEKSSFWGVLQGLPYKNGLFI